MNTNNLFNNALNISKIMLHNIIQKGDAVIDATLGNGYDAAYLAELVGETGCVWAFDIQADALLRAEENIPKHLMSRVRLICAGHERMSDHIKEPVTMILFNLGYLPWGDRSFTTRADTTIAAVKDGLSLLNEHGVVILVVYRGHDEGKREWEALKAFLEDLPQHQYNVGVTDFPNQKNSPPVLVCVQKRA